MSTAFSLDNRLKLCAAYVRQGSKLADIGTDHAYLPVWLCRIGRISRAIAADINPEPLKRGQSTVAQAELSGVIETRLSDGLANIDGTEADDIVIAGMGGELIAKIISDWKYSRDSSKRFILQPMTKSEVLIRRLTESGFKILSQDCCTASKKCYTVLLVQYTGERPVTDETYFYIGGLSPKTNSTHLRFIEEELERLSKMAAGDVRFAALAERIREKVYDKNK